MTRENLVLNKPGELRGAGTVRTMRYWSMVVLVLLVLSTGCSRAIAGVAQPDPHKPPTALSKDGYGIVAGFPDAPVQVDIFTEPQCNHCADLQKDFGDDISRYINTGQLVVTYRPLTFLDKMPGGYSARVSNALFLAIDPATSATAFQAYVQDLWGHQQPGVRGPSDSELADMAKRSGVAAAAVDKIAAGKSVLDATEMDNTNFEYLYEANPLEAGTPTVLDLKTNDLLDIYDNNWLSKLMATA
jgi:protein-disulfide isomerase